MKDRIVLINFYCKECDCEIRGTINSQIILHNLDNNETYTKIRCPYCFKNYYILNEGRDPIDATGRVAKNDLLTDEDNPNFKEYKDKEKNKEPEKQEASS